METKYLSGAGTFSKDPEMFGMGKDWYARSVYGLSLTPKIVYNAEGDKQDDNKYTYIDWISSLGANLYGHNHPGILEAIEHQLNWGLNFSIVHQLEYEVAELLVDKVGMRVWHTDDLQVRFMKTGTDACNAAVRLARAFTGKTGVLSYGYHGWGDTFVAATPPAHGIPIKHRPDIVDIKYGDRASVEVGLQSLRGNLACIIVEHPPYTNINEKEWYAYLREVCNENKALLVIDEVVTGFRFGMGGVCEMYDILPDIVCYGKALGGGLALSAVMADNKLMSWFSREDPVFVSSTQFGETLPLAAAKYVLESWNQEKVEYIWRIGDMLYNGLKDQVNIYGHGARSLFKFKDEVYRAFFIHGMMKRGILVNRPNFPTLAHTEDDVTRTINAATDVVSESHDYSFDDMKKMMKDKMPRILFRNR